MSITIQNNTNVLGWYLDSKYQNHNKNYAYNKVFPFVTELGTLPPFQIAYNEINTITKFDIIKFSDATETSVESQLTTVGFNIQSFDDYDLAIYPGTLAFTGSWEPDLYYARIQDGTTTWYSDIFLFVSDISGCLKLEWWHNEDFIYPDGRIQYTYPYKTFAYLRTDIGKPGYKKLKEVSIRDGKEFDLKVTTWKEYKFEIFSPEYFADALSHVCQHDNVEVTYDDVNFPVEKFESVPNWIGRGDIARIECIFTTDSHTVINGRGVLSTAYESASCGCLSGESITTKAVLDENSIAYSGHYYLDEDGITQIPFILNDYLLVTDSIGRNRLEFYNGHGYTGYTPHGDFLPVCIESTQQYFFEYGYYYQQTTILTAPSTGVDTWKPTGLTFDGVSVEIWTKTSGGSPVLITTGTAAEFNGAGIEFTSAGAVAVQARPATLPCSEFDNSNWFLVGSSGIGWMTVGTTNTVG
ncbi:MAG: hypothetical protein GY787_23105 [Alteromonadales bacterium]|nr:hypothetical protein [Alteromonadales bacterium]